MSCIYMVALESQLGTIALLFCAHYRRIYSDTSHRHQRVGWVGRQSHRDGRLWAERGAMEFAA